MDEEKFGEFLCRISEGKIERDEIALALLIQNDFSEDDYKKIGEILVERKILSDSQLISFLEAFKNEKKNIIK